MRTPAHDSRIRPARAAPGVFAALAALAALAPPATAQDPEALPSFVASGEATSAAAASWAETPPLGPEGMAFMSETALGLALDARSGPIRSAFAARFSVLTGAAAAAAALAQALGAAEPLVALGPESPDAGVPSYALTLSLEKAYLKWNHDYFSLTAGRQSIDWGKAMAFRPADLFGKGRAEAAGASGPGVDALRLSVPVGALGSAEAVAEPWAERGAGLGAGTYAARLSGSLAGSDLSLAAGWDGPGGQASLAGALKTDLVAGLWSEAAYAWAPGAFGEGKLSLTVGADYSFLEGGLLVAGEYHYDANGSPPGGGPSIGPSLPGRHYAYALATVRTGDYSALALSATCDLEAALASGSCALVLDIAQGATLGISVSGGNGSLASRVAAWNVSAGVSLAMAF